VGLGEPLSEPPAKADESKDDPARAGVRASWSVLRGRLAASELGHAMAWPAQYLRAGPPGAPERMPAHEID